jgi:hypothetical protein
MAAGGMIVQLNLRRPVREQTLATKSLLRLWGNKGLK